MKRPNGYGAVINLGKGRRKPYAVRVTDTRASSVPDADGTYRRKYNYIGYYATKNKAYSALDKYNENKTPINYLGITFGEIWQIWADRNLETASASRAYSYSAAAEKCRPLFDIRITQIRLAELQQLVDSYAGTSKSNLNNIKIVMSFVFDWAIKNDIVNKDYSKYVEISPKQTVNHSPLTHLQVDDLKAVPAPSDVQKITLMFLYTGCRISELFKLKKEDIHIEEQYLHIGKAKTAAGVRIVPIADKVLPIFKYYYDSPGKKLFPIDLQTYREEFSKLFPGRTPHDTRSTFISFMLEKDVPLVTVQKIVGHASGNVTADIYTKLSLAPLLEAVNRL